MSDTIKIFLVGGLVFSWWEWVEGWRGHSELVSQFSSVPPAERELNTDTRVLITQCELQQGRQAFLFSIFYTSDISSVNQWISIEVTKRCESKLGYSCMEEKGSERKISKETECVLFIRWPVSYALQANMIMHKSIFSHCGKKKQETQKVRS